MNKINNDVITLKTKLLPPRLSDSIRRRRLETHFDKLKNSKLITITAGAGYGKSTAAAQACRLQGFKTVWYRLDASDQDVLVLIHYLIAGIRQHFNSFGRLTLERMQTNNQLKIEQRSILTLLVHEMEQTINTHLAIVLDDFHLIQDNQEIGTAVNFLVNNLPDTVHLVLISRTSLKIDLASLIANRTAAAITERELAFTREEIACLYQQVFDMALLDQELKELKRKTRGWAAGLVLFQYSLSKRETTVLEQHLNLLTGNNHLFGDYLQQNVFEDLPLDVRNFVTIQRKFINRS